MQFLDDSLTPRQSSSSLDLQCTPEIIMDVLVPIRDGNSEDGDEVTHENVVEDEQVSATVATESFVAKETPSQRRKRHRTESSSDSLSQVAGALNIATTVCMVLSKLIVNSAMIILIVKIVFLCLFRHYQPSIKMTSWTHLAKILSSY